MWKLKLDADGKPVLKDDKPMFVDDKGAEVAFDYNATMSTITRLNSEAKGHRTAKEEAETKLKAFEGIDDPEAAKKALDTVANLEQGHLVTAGKVEEIKVAARKAAEDQVAAAAKASTIKIQELEKANAETTKALYDEKIGGAFSRSAFIADKIAVPADMLQAQFGRHFEVKEGKIVAKGSDGNQIYSKVKAGEPADFDEALEYLVDAYPQKDHILKGSGHRGDNARQQNGKGGQGGKTIQRAEFEKLDAGAQARAMTGKVEERLTVVD